jgi:putative peptide maturation dehydrogenase
MMRIRRSPHALLYLEDEYLLDLEPLLQAKRPPTAPEAGIVALAILTGERHRLRRDELELLLSIPADEWIDADGHNQGVVRDLADKGLLLSDTADAALSRLRERDEALSANAWNLYAALYHYMTQWSGVDSSEGVDDEAWIADRDSAGIRDHLAIHGSPPPAFAKSQGSVTLNVPLPGADRDGELYRTLTARRTTRSFDQDVPMTLEQFDTVMRYVFGFHGYSKSPEGIVRIKRTSPSGGGFHPTEVYPIVTNVETVAPGVYHYNVHDHSLELLRELDPSEAAAMASSFMAGQTYFGAANVSFVLTARFYRNHWKYRQHQRAYAALLMDAAHLSQTLYLVSGDLGLGAFVTIAINSRDIEADLGFDGVTEGVIAMAGCGVRAADGSPLEPQFSAALPG